MVYILAHAWRRVSHYAIAFSILSCIALVSVMGLDNASALGGWFAQTVGRRLSASRIAHRNLASALPALSALERGEIVRRVWNNLGRNVAELPFLAQLKRSHSGPGWEIHGEEHIEALRATGGRALFFSGHFGNWELILPIAAELSLPVAGFYRAASNVTVNTIIQSMRQKAMGPRARMFPKGHQGAREALAHLLTGGSLGFLVDQKMNDGIAVPFFHRDAMTAPAIAQLALRFDLPIIPIYVMRLSAGRFRMVCEAPLNIARTGDRHADIHTVMTQVNSTLERWITDRPDSWLWLHRRWPREA